MSRSPASRGLPLLIVFALAAGCNEGGSSAGGGLLLSRISVSVIPGGSDQVRALAADGNASPGDVTVSSSDDRVATATANGPTVSIAGVAVGRCSVTITGADGRRSSLPVQVYDPRAMDAGELSIAFTTDFEEIAWNQWRPVPPDGYHALGSLMLPRVPPGSPAPDPNGVRAVMVVKGNTESAIAPTSDYEQITDLFEIGWNGGEVFWRPRCPTTYKALGLVTTLVAWLDPSPPPPAYPTACVREDLTTAGSLDEGAPVYMWNIHFTDGAWFSYGVWSVDQPVIGSHSGAYLAPGTFVYASAHASSVSAPTADPAINVLDVDLQLLGEAPAQAVTPKLTADPAPETAPTLSRAILVPCSIVKDPLHDAAWQIANSPFYRLERSVFWRLIAHNYNNTSVEQPNSVQFTKGITTEESNRIWNSTTISIGVEAGIEFKPVSAKVTATVSREMGYETQYSLSELSSRTDTLAMQTPSKKAVAVWQEVSRFNLYRHNGTNLEVADSWDIGTETFYSDEYPGD